MVQRPLGAAVHEAEIAQPCVRTFKWSKIDRKAADLNGSSAASTVWISALYRAKTSLAVCQFLTRAA